MDSSQPDDSELNTQLMLAEGCREPWALTALCISNAAAGRQLLPLCQAMAETLSQQRGLVQRFTSSPE